MVADTAQGSKKPKEPKKLNKGFRQPVPLITRMKVRNLYLGACLGNIEIGEQVGLTANQVAQIVYRDGLPAIRKRKQAKAIEATDARTDETLEQFNEQLAREAEEISLGALQRAREEVDSPGEFGARNFQSWTGGINNLVKAARTVRGLDAKQAADAGSTVNLFIVSGERVQRSEARPEPKNVTPEQVAIEAQVSTT